MRRPPIIVWFRQDLRLADNPAIEAAIAEGAPIVPVYILDDAAPGRWRMGGASRWWLHQSLTSLSRDLAGCGAPLVLRRGRSGSVLEGLIRDTGARKIVWSRMYEPWAVETDRKIEAALQRDGVEVETFNASLLWEPWEVLKDDGTPYKVLAAFANACRARGTPGRPQPAPKRLNGMEKPPPGDDLADWALTPSKPDWAGGLRKAWRPGEREAGLRLADFVGDALEDYGTGRNLPAVPGSSSLSPFLHWGEIGPRQVWHAVSANRSRAAGSGVDAFLRELVWREFARSLLYHLPEMPESPLQPQFAAMRWRKDSAGLVAWQRGRTGYPIVDAGMRQLWATGWMHNRVRMIVASFLIKDLLIDWREGEAWFWDTLVDADLANNSANWQWVAGSGANAAPFFRVFNPSLQGAKFDRDGDYVRQWVPELAKLPSNYIHEPARAPAEALEIAGVKIGDSYPAPIVDHKAARDRALTAFKATK